MQFGIEKLTTAHTFLCVPKFSSIVSIMQADIHTIIDFRCSIFRLITKK
ncbi:hypothetical protein SAMN05192585_12060 [Acetanaerobacterium elongatum]|uniref:Uncharacterized protein n=1 Tax=Acetanaerobacterium elongatum TaxID=258515 RepID=A0A1H0BU69_9FIRM|nr:hypothetical protein SAMN05192585_12060 [Acetanaerobacterium elongatum]